jgi:hypothetical protein
VQVLYNADAEKPTPRQDRGEGIKVTLPEKKGESILSTLASRGVVSRQHRGRCAVPIPVTLRLPVKRTANCCFTSEGFRDIALHR